MCHSAQVLSSPHNLPGQYRETEKLHMDEHAFLPITLQRPMQLFNAALVPAASLGQPFVPNHDFLVRLVTDHRSHQAMLRAEAAGEFKNLENFLRGRHRQSSTTKSAISKRLAITPTELASWAHGREDGPLAPKLLNIFAMLETIPGAVASQALAKVVLCSCCGRNMLDDRAVFWNRQSIAYGASEYEFAERLLRAAVGGSGIIRFIAELTGETIASEELDGLAHPSRYPMSHWLELVQAHYRVSTLVELSVKMQLMAAPECRVPYARLKKWSSGQGLMPVAVAQALASGTGGPNSLWSSFLLARTLTFVIDFLVSAAPGSEPERSRVQEIVYCRLRGLGQNVRMAGSTAATQTSLVAGNIAFD